MPGPKRACSPGEAVLWGARKHALSGTGSLQPASASGGGGGVCRVSADLSVLQTDSQISALSDGETETQKDTRLCQCRVLGMKHLCRSWGTSERELYPSGAVWAKPESEESAKPGAQADPPPSLALDSRCSPDTRRHPLHA